MPEDWRSHLLRRHSDLFRRTVHGREVTSGYPTVGAGWKSIIETAIARMATAVANCPPGALSILQIKEKLGGLRIYVAGQSLPSDVLEKVREAIDLAEARADCTCEICGRIGRLYDKAGWLATRCELHGQGALVPEPRGRENLHIKWTVEDGEWRLLSCRRYDRERDAFFDVPLPDSHE
jgi:hypothetical protein